MPTYLPPFIDLTVLAQHLQSKGTHPKLQKQLEQAWRVQSCLGDLKQAADTCAALMPMVEELKASPSPASYTTVRALLVTSVMLYARATATSGKQGERGSIQLEQRKLAPEQLEDHTAIVDVRNQAFAHVYSARNVADHIWHQDFFFAVQTGNGRWRPASASNQTGVHFETIKRLSRMIPVAREMLLSKFRDRMSAVRTAINETPLSTADLAAALVDPVQVFGSEAAALHVVADAHGSETTTSFWVAE